MIIEDFEREEKKLLIKQKFVNILSMNFYKENFKELMDEETDGIFMLDLDHLRKEDQELYQILICNPLILIEQI